MSSIDLDAPLLTSTEVARRLGVTRATVMRWFREETIEGIRLPSGHARFPQHVVEAHNQLRKTA